MGGSRKNEKHAWTPMSNEHLWIHMNSSEFHKRCSWQVRFWTIVFTFFDLLLCVVVFAFVGFIVLLVFGFSSCAGLALPKTIHCHCCKTCFFLLRYVWKWGDLFSLQRDHFGVKKGHFMLRHTHLLILFWTCVFVASMLCWLAPSKTYPTEIYRFTLAQKASL